MISFIVTLLPIVLYTGAINLESIFNVSELLEVSQPQGMNYTIWAIGLIGSLYAIFGGLKAVAVSDTLNGYGLLVGGLAIPFLALLSIGEGNPLEGLSKVYHNAPEKFNVIGAQDSVMPEVLFTGLIINQIYFWCMNQTIIQRALGAKNLKEAQKGLLLTGLLKILVPLIIILPGVIGYYYYGALFYEQQDSIYPELIKKVLPASFVGLFAAVVMGAVLSTFNSVLNSAATIFSIDIYQRHLNPNVSEIRLVKIGKITSAVLALFAYLAPMVANALDGLYQLLQQLNGIFIPIARSCWPVFLPKISPYRPKSPYLSGFYICCTFIFKVDLHFVHVWGIEFLLNMTVMAFISYFVPKEKPFQIKDLHIVEMKGWKYTQSFSAFLVIATLLIYILMGNFNSA